MKNWFRRVLTDQVGVSTSAANRSINCPNCGEEVSPKQVVCENCYMDLMINCSSCGKALYRWEKKCISCGTLLQGGGTESEKEAITKLNMNNVTDSYNKLPFYPPGFPLLLNLSLRRRITVLRKSEK